MPLPGTSGLIGMFTILGASGFIGSRLVASLRAAGEEVMTPAREDEAYLGRALGHAVYCIGVTADFRARPIDTVDAHVTRLMPLLRKGRFESLLYLSSTRIYRGQRSTGEDDSLTVLPERKDDLYNISKLMGEAICLSSGRDRVHVVRLSNVYGAEMAGDNFLPAVITEALKPKRIDFHTTLDSCKDYVAIEDVVKILPQVAEAGRHRIYNLASGRNVTNNELAQGLKKLTGCAVTVDDDAAHVTFPQISIARVAREFGFSPQSLDQHLPSLVKIFRERMTRE